ncbi:hypothetical protein JWJ90_02880 [Desulfobulbus rhabdoformis]|uniref:hypothetical protein n=1 Tax=Desulfobulbus rhabdoformis TaxID=34032 RepID=UPI0019657F34|nr:hypothetical protein [Desulfobulbus rhabdoformis]MBM9613224.1 hypothetical protein [Desulfobulbus rhabdoformis]
MNAHGFKVKDIKANFGKFTGYRATNANIVLNDVIMSAFAEFHLKDQSLLAFDVRWRREPENLHTVYGVGDIFYDSQGRVILNEVAPHVFRK